MLLCTFQLKCGYTSEMWLHICPIRFVGTFLKCSHISVEKYKTTLKTAVSIYPGSAKEINFDFYCFTRISHQKAYNNDGQLVNQLIICSLNLKTKTVTLTILTRYFVSTQCIPGRDIVEVRHTEYYVCWMGHDEPYRHFVLTVDSLYFTPAV